jgi:hypothetical protein
MSEYRVLETRPVPATNEGWKELIDRSRYVYCSHLAMSPGDLAQVRRDLMDAEQTAVWRSPGLALGVPLVVDNEVLPGLVELRALPNPVGGTDG